MYQYETTYKNDFCLLKINKNATNYLCLEQVKLFPLLFPFVIFNPKWAYSTFVAAESYFVFLISSVYIYN